MWVRGLKPTIGVTLNSPFASHPVWVRGLKRAQQASEKPVAAVAPRVGAWIETPSCPEPTRSG